MAGIQAIPPGHKEWPDKPPLGPGHRPLVPGRTYTLIATPPRVVPEQPLQYQLPCHEPTLPVNPPPTIPKPQKALIATAPAKPLVRI